MVLGKNAAYGVECYPSRGTNTVFKPGVNGYRLKCFSLSKPSEDPVIKQGRRGGKTAKSGQVVWEQRVPIRVTALVRAGKTLYAAGSPDIVDPHDPHAAWEGRKGGVLAAFATEDGKKLFECQLPAPPNWTQRRRSREDFT